MRPGTQTSIWLFTSPLRKVFFDRQHDHIIFTDSGEVKEFCDPRIEIIKRSIEDIFDIQIHNHSLYFYGTKKKRYDYLATIMAVDLLLGLQWGDEGKGKIVDVLTTHYDIIARFQGGPNAGHTLEFDGIKHVLHTIPSGIFHPTALNLIGNGVVIDPAIFKKEIEGLQPFNIDIANKLLISKKAHLILPTHRLLDAASEAAKGKGKIGSTLKGIGPTYMDKTGRNGIRVGDILTDQWEVKYQLLKEKHLKILAGYPQNDTFDLNALEAEFMAGIAIIKSCKIVDSEQFIHEAQAQGKNSCRRGPRLPTRH